VSLGRSFRRRLPQVSRSPLRLRNRREMFTTKRADCCKLIDVLFPYRLLGAGQLALTLSLSLSLAPAAHADTPSAEGTADARRGQARVKFEEGVKAYGERRYQDAVRAFQEADAIEPSAPLSYNIARAFEQLDDVRAALRWYRDYLRRIPQAQNVAEVQNRVTQLALQLAEHGVQQISVLSNPSGASVSVDGRPLGVTPFTTELAPGTHRLTLRQRGYRELETEFLLEARLPRDLLLRLEPEQSASVTGPGVTRTPPPAGGERPFGVAPWLVMGAGAVSLVGSLGFELGRRSAESDAERAAQLEYQEHFQAMQSRQTAARVLAGMGGALLVTGGVLYLLNTPKQPSTSLALSCAPGGCGVLASGSFR
jgi:tetratricopeptide (TPR) repeat protein